MNTPNKLVIDLVKEIIAEVAYTQKIGSKAIPTVDFLDLPKYLLKKRLKKLGNRDIALLAETIKSLKLNSKD